MLHQLKRFNIRVYGLLLNNKGEILVADEQFSNGNRATKFPGGGLELGEGTIQGVIREFKEETGIDVEVVRHFYTTDFFQPSFFDTNSQIISIYYLLRSDECDKVNASEKKFDFEVAEGEEAESFRWVKLENINLERTITLPIDKVVVRMLNELDWKV